MIKLVLTDARQDVTSFCQFTENDFYKHVMSSCQLTNDLQHITKTAKIENMLMLYMCMYIGVAHVIKNEKKQTTN